MKKEAASKAVFLPGDLYHRIRERAKATGFSSVDEYVIFVLSEVLGEESNKEVTLSQEQEAEVKRRLKALGYLD